jgi:hypothetical protein
MSEQPADGFRVDLSGWTTMRALEKWDVAARNGHIATMNELMAGVVKSWPYASDPSLPGSYSDLSLEEWANTFKAVRDCVGKFFSNAIR